MADLFLSYDADREPGDRLAPEVAEEICLIASQDECGGSGGGDPELKANKGQPDGYAPLGFDRKVPVENLPDVAIQPAAGTEFQTNKGVAGGYAPLDFAAKVPVANMPDGLEKTVNKGAANGYASLDSAGKVPVSQLPNSIMEYQGVWNASTNVPALANGTGSPGDVYRVGTAGTQFGITFDVGDYAVYNGTVWEKSDTTDAVASVNGKTGIVTLTKADVGLPLADNTADASKNVLSATKLTTARTLNGVAFDGTANITIPVDPTADAGYEKVARKGAALGYASLDATTRLPSAQLPLTAVEWKGLFNAATNTPALANGTGNMGDMYQVSTAGTQFGLTLAVGDVVFYDGAAWLKLGGANSNINSYPVKTAPVDADEFPLADSAAAFASKKITWANLKTAIAAWYNPLVATLTNKTMSGKLNTFTDIPSSATPDASRLVCLTAGGGTTAENGANTWAKVASFESTASTATLNLVLGLVGLRHGTPGAADAVILSVGVNIPSASDPIANPNPANPVVGVEIIAGGGSRSFSPDSFKIINDGFGTPVQLWVRKKVTYGSVSVYEMARNSAVIPLADMVAGVETGDITAADIKSAEAAGVDTGDIEAAALIAGWTVTYHNSAPWQSAVPTGTVTNVQTAVGVSVFGQLISTRQAATAYSMTFA